METALEFYVKRITGFESMSFEQRRTAVQEAHLADKQHTKTTLKEVFRVKPAIDEKSKYGYKNGYGTYVNCYSLSQCIPMRPLISKPRTAKQKLATAKLVKQNQINSPANQAAVLAKAMIENDVCVIDTKLQTLTV